ncbi:MAG: DUF1402 family protein [Deltaproteobacteria bacterium]|nr:DUF1402 family protein [Deltaproteobacteria bacterium]
MGTASHYIRRSIAVFAVSWIAAWGVISFAQTTAPAKPATDWNKELAELCTYDPEYCKKLKNEDGTWVRPKKEILAALKSLSPKIQTYSEKFGVDPRAVAGAVLAENSLNVSISDNVQDFLVKYGLASGGDILGKKFSFGWGQLYMEAAREAENFAAKLEKRAPKTDDQLSEDLLKPDLAIYYVAALMRTIQDEYQKQGIDISKNPELLATVYNLGKPQERSAKTKASGKSPRVNYFGFFVKHYMDDIETAVGKPKVQTLVADQKDVTKKDGTATAVATKSAAVSTPSPEAEPKVWRTVMIKSLALYVAPPTCKLQNGQGSVKAKYESFQNFASSGIAEKATGYKVLAPAIDCEAEAWSLVRTDDGTTGWVKNSDLEKSSSKQLVVAPKCTNFKVGSGLFEARDGRWRRGFQEPRLELLGRISSLRRHVGRIQWRSKR